MTKPAYVEAHRDEVDGNAHRLVVRNGCHAEREVLTAAGAVPVRQPRVNDRRVDPISGERQRFSSAILPAWARKSAKVGEVLPLLYFAWAVDVGFRAGVGAVLGHWLGVVGGHHLSCTSDVIKRSSTQVLDTHLLPAFGSKPLASITPADVREWHATTLTDRPTLRSHAYSLLRTIFTSAVNDELIGANPCRILGAGRTKRVHTIKPASVAELAELTAAMPDRLALMVTLASWCALRFGELIELRRGDVDLSAEVIRVRRGAVRTNAGTMVTTPKSDAGVRDVDIPPHIIPLIEQHLAKYVGAERDSLLFRRRSRRAPATEHAVPPLVQGEGGRGPARSALA